MSSHEVLVAFLGTLSEDALRLLTQNPLAIKETITRLATAAGMEFTRTLHRKPGSVEKLLYRCGHPCEGADVVNDLTEAGLLEVKAEPPREVTFRIFTLEPARFALPQPFGRDPIFDRNKIEAYLKRKGYRFPDVDEALLAAAEDPDLGLRDMGRPRTYAAVNAYLRGRGDHINIAPCCEGPMSDLTRDIDLMDDGYLEVNYARHFLAVRI